MNPVFTLQVGEYFVAEELRKRLENVSVFVPTSPQEKECGKYLLDERIKDLAKCLKVALKS